jgi:hypothetical protein
VAASRVVLVEIQPRRPADGVAVPLRVIGGGTTRADHFGQQWLPALARFPRLSMQLGFDGRAFGEGAVSTVGDIAIALGSSALAPFASYLYERALVTIKTGPADGADGAFTDLWTGRAAGAVVAGKQLIIRLADPSENLLVPVLPNQFTGTGGLEGPADLKGRVKPKAWGACEGVPAILIDPASGIYLLVENQATVSAVYDGGVAFAAGPAAVDFAALQALAVPVGAVATSSSAAGTLIRPWTRPTFTMTADIVAGALTKPAEIAEAIVSSRSAIAFAAGQVAAFDAAQPGPIGAFIDDERTLVDELDRIFAGLGSWWNLNLSGEIEIGQFAFGASAQSFAFEVAEITRARVLTPTRRRLVGYRRNFRPLTDSEIAGVIKAADLSGAIDWQTQIAGAGKPVDNATRNNVTSGTATPTGGVNGDLYFETDAQAWWSRIGGVWQKVSDATAANIAAGIAGQGALATLNSADWQTQVAGAGKPENNADVTATRLGGGPSNANFEAGDKDWVAAAGWSIVNEPANAHAGSWVAKFTGPGSGALRNRFATLTPNGYPTAPGERFIVGGYVKTTAGASFGFAGWRVSFRDAAGNEVGAPSAFIQTASTSWAFVRTLALAPANAAFAVLEGIVSAWVSGTVYIDDGFLAPVSRDIDDVGDGVTFKRTTANDKTGAGRAFAALVSNTRIASAVQKEQSVGGTVRAMPIGGAESATRDGVAVNFAQAWSGPPIVRFEGGVSYDSAFTGKQEQVFSALNMTTTGFTPSLRVKAIGTPSPQNEGPFADTGGTPRYQVEKNILAQDKNDSYVFNLSVTVTNCENPPGEPQDGQIILGIYTRTVAGGAWTKRTAALLTSTGVHQVAVVVDGLGIDAAFGVHVESTGFCNSTFNPAASSVSYDTGTTSGESSATPTGATDARMFVLGNQQGV